MSSPLKPHDLVYIVGKRGSGKSHYFREHILPHEPRVLTWDIHGEHPCDVRLTVEELADQFHRLTDPGYRIAVTPASRMPQAAADSFTDLVELVEGVGGYTFAIDEVGIIGDRAAEMLEYVATQSRHFGERAGFDGVPVIFLAQRAVQIPKTAREQCSQIVSFRQDNDADVKALGERPGFPAERVRTLNRERHEFVHWREDGPLTSNAGKEHRP